MPKGPYLKIFFDTEFTELTQKAKLLSIALVAETGEQFYAECTDYLPEQINPWVQENVLEHFYLEKTDATNPARLEVKDNDAVIADAIRKWLLQFEIKNPGIQFQFWADVPAWDWVLFCQLFGGALHIPANIHFMCMDLATLLFCKGMDYTLPRIQLLETHEWPENYRMHNALSDATLGLQILKQITHEQTTL